MGVTDISLSNVFGQSVPQVGTGSSETSIAETVVGAWYGAGPSAGRPQRSGNETAVSDQVLRCLVGQGLKNEAGDLELDALSDRQPVQFTQHWRYVVPPSRSSDQPCPAAF